MAALLAGHSQLKGLSRMFYDEDCVAISCHPGKKIEGLFGAIKDMVASLYCIYTRSSRKPHSNSTL